MGKTLVLALVLVLASVLVLVWAPVWASVLALAVSLVTLLQLRSLQSKQILSKGWRSSMQVWMMCLAGHCR